MQTKRFLALLVSPAVASAALAFTLGAAPQAAASSAPLAAMAAPRAASLPGVTQWEYATVPLVTHATKQTLDTWGSDGWELVAVVPSANDPDQLVAYLKRPIEAS
ncbi:hypothetical protein ACWDYJ_22110 [Streptomyces sp. NPDC003042]